jgi:hypothetical protein
MKYKLIIRDNRNNVLLKSDKTIPYICKERSHPAYVADLVEEVKSQLGLEIIICYCHSFMDEAIYVARLLSSSNQEMRFDIKDNVSSKEQKDLIRNISDTDLHEWAQFNWYNDLTKYLNNIFEDYEIEQVKTSSLSTVIKIKADKNYYLKKVPSFFHHELTITNYLSTAYPQNVPEIIKIDKANSILITEEIALPLLEKSNEIEVWINALNEYAKMQLKEICNVNDLISLGIPDRRLERLLTQIDIITNHIAIVATNKEYSLTKSEIEEWNILVPKMRRSIISQKGLMPETIEHGDFYLANIASDKEGAVFFDFTDISVTHPFFSLITFLSECEFSEGQKEFLIEAYLSNFSKFYELTKLRKIYEEVSRIGEIHLAYTYLMITKNVHDRFRWEVEKNFPSCIRHVIKAYQGGE